MIKSKKAPGLLFLVFIAVLFSGCGGSGDNPQPNVEATFGEWTWVSGSNTPNQSGNYGIPGIAASANVPGARFAAVSWQDSSGSFWLFGGEAYDSSNIKGLVNDLWQWDGTNWTWISGSKISGASGVYGSKGTADANNVPGARDLSASWTDSSDNLWLFGGVGNDTGGSLGWLNDLWRWDGNNWTWISGANITNQAGVYGTQGVSTNTNIPGARDTALTWVDDNGDVWLFGGAGYDSTGTFGYLNDMWLWDGSNWTWVYGNKLADQPGVYGTKGVAAASNFPGGRNQAISWTDGKGNFWLFGGQGYDSKGNKGLLNDLWYWDGSQWTWISGSDQVYQVSVYGTKGVANSSNMPGARDAAISWIDGSGNLWLLGGNGGDRNGHGGTLNDLWRWDGVNWTWLSGSDLYYQSNAHYGTQGIAAGNNTPGGKDYAVSWVDGNTLWLFGGSGFDGSFNYGLMNDLWIYQP